MVKLTQVLNLLWLNKKKIWEVITLIMKAELYLFTLLLTSISLFMMVGAMMETIHPYTDLLLTVAVVQLVMSKLIGIDKKEDGNVP